MARPGVAPPRPRRQSRGWPARRLRARRLDHRRPRATTRRRGDASARASRAATGPWQGGGRSRRRAARPSPPPARESKQVAEREVGGRLPRVCGEPLEEAGDVDVQAAGSESDADGWTGGLSDVEDVAAAE